MKLLPGALHRVLRETTASVALSLILAPAWAQTRIEAQVQQIIQAYHSKIALCAYHLTTGKILATNEDKPVQTASIIKLAMLWTALRQVPLGKAQWDEKITLTPGEAVGGSGILHFLDTLAAWSPGGIDGKSLVPGLGLRGTAGGK